MHLPLFSARGAVMKPCQRPVAQPSSALFSRMDLHRDSLLCLADHVAGLSDFPLSKCAVDEDDGTASTVSSIDEDSFSSSCSEACVSFAEPLVTRVYERPITTLAEKHVLFYSDLEYRSFRRDYFESKQRSDSLVQFDDDLVTEVHEYSIEGRKEDLFYNDDDLQRFLDEFVASLNNSLSP